MKIIRWSVLVTLSFAAAAQPVTRPHPENALLSQPAVRVTVGPKHADIVGKDNIALQAAVDLVAQRGGGVVEVLPGVYAMRDSLHLRSRVTLRGHGEKTVLQKDAEVRSLLAADGDFGECAITVANPEGFDIGDGLHIATKKVSGFHTICATILNKEGNYLTLNRPLNADCMMTDGAWAATIFPVISAYNLEDFRIECLTIDGNREKNGRIDGCRGAGIFFYQGDGGIIENCIVRNYHGDGISFQQSNDVQVLGCTVEECAGGGIHPGSGSQRAVVRGCKALRNGADGFFFCWRVRNALIEDNEFRDNGATGMSIGHKDSDNLIRRNLIESNKQGGVRWREETEPMAAHRITFEQNTVRNNGNWGLFVDGETRGTIIRNNTIEDTVGTQKTGIRIGEKVFDVLLENNTIRADLPVLNAKEKQAARRAATLPNVPYGLHERQVLDFYRAESDTSTPLLFFIHGGGWVRGDKAEVENLDVMLAAGVSVVSINYRLTWQAQQAGVTPPVAWPINDAARALQFVRSKATEWNIDKTRIAACGRSAGACSSLYLALHDDLAEPSSADPIARESTRVRCAAVYIAQTSLDPKQMKRWTPNSRYGGHAFGFMDPNDLATRDTRFNEFLKNRKSVLKWIREYSPNEHVSKGDPPLYLEYRTPPALGQEEKDPTHTANFGVKLQERCKKVGETCELNYPGASALKHATAAEFLLDALKH